MGQTLKTIMFCGILFGIFYYISEKDLDKKIGAQQNKVVQKKEVNIKARHPVTAKKLPTKVKPKQTKKSSTAKVIPSSLKFIKESERNIYLSKITESIHGMILFNKKLNCVYIFSKAQKAIKKEFSLPRGEITDIQFKKGPDELWVSSKTPNKVIVYNAKNFSVKKEYKLKEQPFNFLSHRNGALYYSSPKGSIVILKEGKTEMVFDKRRDVKYIEHPTQNRVFLASGGRGMIMTISEYNCEEVFPKLIFTNTQSMKTSTIFGSFDVKLSANKRYIMTDTCIWDVNSLKYPMTSLKADYEQFICFLKEDSLALTSKGIYNYTIHKHEDVKIELAKKIKLPLGAFYSDKNQQLYLWNDDYQKLQNIQF